VRLETKRADVDDAGHRNQGLARLVVPPSGLGCTDRRVRQPGGGKMLCMLPYARKEPAPHAAIVCMYGCAT
jgi:hypothetical protein